MEKFDYKKADENGTLVKMAGDVPYCLETFNDVNDDYAILYPNGQFRRIILDIDGFKELKNK